MERRFQMTPGYDCRVECKHEPQGNHGIASDSWCYTVIDGPRAVTLEVMSGRYPSTVDLSKIPLPARSLVAGAQGAVLSFHQQDPEFGSPCELVGLCKGDLTFIGARELWDAYGDGRRPEQSEEFWRALEARLPEP